MAERRCTFDTDGGLFSSYDLIPTPELEAILLAAGADTWVKSPDADMRNLFIDSSKFNQFEEQKGSLHPTWGTLAYICANYQSFDFALAVRVLQKID